MRVDIFKSKNLIDILLYNRLLIMEGKALSNETWLLFHMDSNYYSHKIVSYNLLFVDN